MYSLPSNTCAEGSAVCMWVTSGGEIAPAARRASSAASMSAAMACRGAALRRAPRGQILLDLHFGLLVDAVEEQQCHAQQEGNGGIHAYCQLDAMHRVC